MRSRIIRQRNPICIDGMQLDRFEFG